VCQEQREQRRPSVLSSFATLGGTFNLISLKIYMHDSNKHCRHVYVKFSTPARTVQPLERLGEDVDNAINSSKLSQLYEVYDFCLPPPSSTHAYQHGGSYHIIPARRPPLGGKNNRRATSSSLLCSTQGVVFEYHSLPRLDCRMQLRQAVRVNRLAPNEHSAVERATSSRRLLLVLDGGQHCRWY
jgi:hypothetical protein